MKFTNAALKITGIVIAFVQLVDILLHAAANQLEPLRVSSNVVILLWLAMMASGRLNVKPRLAAGISVAMYLLLNLVFLALEGVTNPEQGGTVRVTLLVFVFITVTLSVIFTYLRKKSMLPI